MNLESKLDWNNLPLSGITVPEGSLFHPSCGHDTFWPLIIFLDKIDTFHFADCASRINLPMCESKPENGRRLDSRQPEVIPVNIVKECSSRVVFEGERIDQSMNSIPRIGWINLISQVREDIWTIAEKEKIDIFRHRQDGYLTFLGIDDIISVFYYTHESGGEGGGAQYWLGRYLFLQVLDRLANGGIIVTDGISYDESEDDCPWNSHFTNGSSEFSFSNKGKEYHFSNIGHFRSRENEVYAWKVDKVELKNFITDRNMRKVR